MLYIRSHTSPACSFLVARRLPNEHTTKLYPLRNHFQPCGSFVHAPARACQAHVLSKFLSHARFLRIGSRRGVAAHSADAMDVSHTSRRVRQRDLHGVGHARRHLSPSSGRPRSATEFRHVHVTIRSTHRPAHGDRLTAHSTLRYGA